MIIAMGGGGWPDLQRTGWKTVAEKGEGKTLGRRSQRGGGGFHEGEGEKKRFQGSWTSPDAEAKGG